MKIQPTRVLLSPIRGIQPKTTLSSRPRPASSKHNRRKSQLLLSNEPFNPPKPRLKDDMPFSNLLNLLFPKEGTIDVPKPAEKPTPSLGRESIEKLGKDKTFKVLDVELNDLSDLIALGKRYEEEFNDDSFYYSIDIKTLSGLVGPLTQLQTLIGLDDVKQTIFYQVIFYLQNLDDQNQDMLHSVIEGAPGVGKTELPKILAKIYKAMGILSKDTFKIVKRSDLVGGFLGQTAMKTQKVLDSCKGGVLFIDEAYSLGNKQGRDSYAKECIDTLTAHLTEQRSDFICIIAGYKEDLEKCFFAYNRGLERRFVYRYSLNKYKPAELKMIFLKKVRDSKWDVLDETTIRTAFFEKNLAYFKYNGGDMETLFHKSKISHAKRVLYCKPEEKKKLSMDDLEEGMKLFLMDDNINARGDSSKNETFKNMFM
jgi:hypothetical protein